MMWNLRVIVLAAVIIGFNADLQWVSFSTGQSIPQNAIDLGSGSYVARHVGLDETIPGYYATLLSSFKGVYEGVVIGSSSSMEILVVEALPGTELAWVDGPMNSRPDWAVIGGRNARGDPLYCAHCVWSSVMVGGLYEPINDCAEYWAFGAKCESPWKVLTFKSGIVLSPVVYGFWGCTATGESTHQLPDEFYNNITDGDTASCSLVFPGLTQRRMELAAIVPQASTPGTSPSFRLALGGFADTEGLYWAVYSDTAAAGYDYQECLVTEELSEVHPVGRASTLMMAQLVSHYDVQCECSPQCEHILVRFERFTETTQPDSVALCEMESYMYPMDIEPTTLTPYA